MNSLLKVNLLLVLGILSASVIADTFTTKLTAEQWAIPRHGERLIKMPEIKNIVKLWHMDQQQIIQVSYPGGEDGELWLMELRDWLIALGVPSANIKSIVGSGSKDIIKLTVVSTGGNSE